MTINHSKTGGSTSLALSALLLAASVTPQLNFAAGTHESVSPAPEIPSVDSPSVDSPSVDSPWRYFSCPDTKWLGRAAYLAAIGTLLKVVLQKSKAGNDPSFTCSPHAGIPQKFYHFYNRYVAGQKGGRIDIAYDDNGKPKLEPATPTYGLVGTFWANHKDITAFLSICVVLETMIKGCDNHIEKITGKSGFLDRLLSLTKTSPDNA